MIALFYEEAWVAKDYILRIGDIEEIRNQLAIINDWEDLVRCGQSMGPKEDQPKLKELSRFLQKCSDRKEMECFKIKTSTGELGCAMCAETADELEKMRILIVPEEEKKYRNKLDRLFDKLDQYLRSGGNDPILHAKLSARQYINSGIARDDYLD